MATGRGVLADRDRQSEMRQYLIHAALKRADELNRLRDLPDTPPRAEGRRPAQRPDRRRSGRNHDDPRDAGRHHPDRDRRTLFGRIAGRRAAGAATVVAARRIVVCQESRAGQTAAGCAPSRLPRPPAHTGRGQADPVSPIQFLRDVFLDRRVNNRRTAPRRRAAAKPSSSRPTRSNTSNPRMAASSSIISGL